MLLVCWAWRNVGEKPALWAKLKLDYFEARHVDGSRRVPSLKQTLSLGRLKALEMLNPDSWEEDPTPLQLLLQVKEECPNMRKISLGRGFLDTMERNGELDCGADIMVRFAEVNLASTTWNKAVMSSIVRALSDEGKQIRTLGLLIAHMPLDKNVVEKIKKEGVFVKTAIYFFDLKI